MQLLLAVLLSIACLLPTLASASASPVFNSWKELTNPRPIKGLSGAIYYSFPLVNGTKAHVVVVDTASTCLLKPALSATPRPTSMIASDHNACAAVNGGYFNLSDGQSASYVIIDGVEIANPRRNKALISNPKLQPHLEKIFDRSEIRFLQSSAGARQIQICPHSQAVPSGYTVHHSLQAGPQLLPRVTSEEEAFFRRERDGSVSDAIGTAKRAARTALGVTSDGYVILLAVAGKAQEDGSSGLTLAQLSDLMRSLGCTQAINLDGGSSTTMCARLDGNAKASVVCGKSPETGVKSILLLQPCQSNDLDR